MEGQDQKERADSVIVKPDSFDVGKEYVTHGGWKARIIWIQKNEWETPFLHVVHKPETHEESAPILHDGKTGRVKTLLCVGEAPVYDVGHPADLMDHWEDSDE